VQIEVEAPSAITCEDCNCSICAKSGFLHLIVPRSAFRLVRGEDALTTYTFNTGTAKHRFCRTCGIYTHHRRRSDPTLYGINVACLAGVSPFDFAEVPVVDGLAHPSDTGGPSRLAGTLRFDPSLPVSPGEKG
jgi:hypothetical protein